MSKLKELTEKFLGGKHGKIIAQGLLYVVTFSPTQANAQDFPGYDASDNTKKEIKSTTPEVDEDNFTLFESVRQKLMKEKEAKAEPAKTFDKFMLNIVQSKLERVAFSDNSVARITHGYINGSKVEEVTGISYGGIFITVADAENANGNLGDIEKKLKYAAEHENIPTEALSDMKKIKDNANSHRYVQQMVNPSQMFAQKNNVK